MATESYQVGLDSDEYKASNEGLLSSDDVRTGFITGITFEAKAVQYAVVNGLAVFEGCIVLGRADQMEQAADQLRDVAADSGGVTRDVAHGVGITGQQYRWPNALMPYSIDPNLSNQARVTDAIAHWQQNTRMSFVQRTAGNAGQYPNYVHFIPSDGCWSHVGMQGGKQEIGLAGGCGTGATIHEIGHAFGLWHEQSREDRDTFIKVNWANIEAGREHNFNQHISDGDDLGAYDFGSIMHYGAYAFSKNDLPTIEAKSGASFGQRNGLSTGDIAAVHSMYRLWHNNVVVNQTYSTYDSKNAWIHVGNLGWRKINVASNDGVTNVLTIAARAKAFDQKVSVYADGSFVYELSLLG